MVHCEIQLPIYIIRHSSSQPNAAFRSDFYGEAQEVLMKSDKVSPNMQDLSDATQDNSLSISSEMVELQDNGNREDCKN